MLKSSSFDLPETSEKEGKERRTCTGFFSSEGRNYEQFCVLFHLMLPRFLAAIYIVYIIFFRLVLKLGETGQLKEGLL